MRQIILKLTEEAQIIYQIVNTTTGQVVKFGIGTPDRLTKQVDNYNKAGGNFVGHVLEEIEASPGARDLALRIEDTLIFYAKQAGLRLPDNLRVPKQPGHVLPPD